MAGRMNIKETLHVEDDPTAHLKDDASSGVYESDDGIKCDSTNEDYLSAEEDEPMVAADEYDASISSWDSHASKATTVTDSLRTESSSGSSEALDCAANLAKGIRTLSYTQEENWKKINDLITKKDSLIKEMTDLVKTVKIKMSSSSLCARDSENSNLCESCSRPISRGIDSAVRVNDAFWMKHPVDFIEDLFHGDDAWRCVDATQDFSTFDDAGEKLIDPLSIDVEWDPEDENYNKDMLNLDFSKIKVPEGFES